MKKLIAFIAFFLNLATLCSQAQPTITAADAMKVGDLFELKAADASTVTIGPGGASQVWDYSTLTPFGSTYYMSVGLKNIAPNYAPYTNANIATSGPGVYSFYYISANTLELYGHNAKAFDVYTDPEKMFSYPFTYTNSYTDAFAGEGIYFFSDSFSIAGTIYAEADGYGTVVTPYSTFHNALRVKTWEKAQIHYYTSGEIYDVHVTTYNWYINDYHSYVLSIAYDTTTLVGGSPVYSVNASFATKAPNRIRSSSPSASVDIQPNPVSDKLIVHTNEAVSRVTICNLLGQQLKSVDVITGNEIEIPVSDLLPGIYLCNVNTKEGVVTKKIVKE